MSSRTVTTPRGSKVRTTSQRRFILVREFVKKADDTVSSHLIEKRSDKVETLRAEARRHPAWNNAQSPQRSILVIMDTVTGEAIKA